MPVKTVDEYISTHSGWASELAELRRIILSTGLQETIKWDSPAYTFNGKNIVGIGAFKNHFALWFFQGGLLKDPYSRLENNQEGKIRAMRQMRFNGRDQIDPEVIKTYVLEAIQNATEGKAIKPARDKAIEIPQDLKEAIKQDEELKAAFKGLSSGKQREYADHISEAKRETTRTNRLEKIIPMIKEGKGLNDKYRQ